MTSRAIPRRGAAHERALLVGIAVVLLMGTVPVFAHHLPLPGLGELGQLERVGAICLVTLHLALAPIHGVIHVLLAGGLAYAIFDRVRAGVRLRRGMRRLDISPAVPGSRMFVAAHTAGLNPAVVFIAREAGNPAFTFGGWRPKVCISEALESSLSDDELRCVLAHEACHVLRRDPLRLSVLRFLGLTLFWIPALSRMAADVAIEAELEADLAGAGDRPLVMASALIKAAKERTTLRLAHVSPLIRDDLLDVRVRRLAGECPPLPSRITRRAFAGATAALAVVWLSGAVVAHPLHGPDAAGSACLEHSGWAASHLFCTHYVVGGKPCPHAVAASSTTTHGQH
ncbi:MAG: M56 family metallopeptidase [Gemmatimonadaceae bacterium]